MVANFGRIWEAASKDKGRPLLQGVYFDAVAATLTATNSYILVRVPCVAEPGDESGLIPAEALKAAAGKSLAVAKGKVVLQLPNGERAWNLLQGTFPDGDRLLASAPHGQVPVSINAALLKQVADALSAQSKDYIVLDPSDNPLKPIRVWRDGFGAQAIIMPVRRSTTAGPPAWPELTPEPPEPCEKRRTVVSA